MLNSKLGNNILKGLIYLCVAILLINVVAIVYFVFLQGITNLNLELLFRSSGLIVSTLMVILIALVIAVPIGVFSAIYMQLYAKKNRALEIIRFSIDSLSGIPSIIFGLFGLSFFIYFVGMHRSILAGSLTVSLVILPLLIKNTEEAIKTIERSQIEASLALGATRFDTVVKVVVPGCVDGIINGIVLAIGRIIGETAAILFVIGSLAKFPTSIMDPGATLATQLYLILQEPTYAEGGINEAYSLALILVIIVIVLNLSIKLMKSHFKKKRGY
ncbi:phosphate ABC transporter permease PstA [Mycoplasma sp. P36-A1]|uniref:phosphate ABC transporter permease PstA n=1 Tax=Mycoplasma sp. P36-A1 TaxID=3252900 RepID=UPI003C303EDE